METDQKMLERANQKLLDRREEQRATTSLTPLTESIEDVINRAREASKSGMSPYCHWHDDQPPCEDRPQEPDWPGRCCGVSRLYADCTFDTFKGNVNLISGIRELASSECNMVLMGKTGCGKTHIAVSIIKEYRGDCMFITAPDLLLEIRSSFNGGNVSEDEIIKKYSDYSLLIIDDLGAEKTSEYSITTLYIIIDRRIRDMKKTIITTNLNQEQIEETLGARIASRLAGMENIKINMPDYRKKR